MIFVHWSVKREKYMSPVQNDTMVSKNILTYFHYFNSSVKGSFSLTRLFASNQAFYNV